MGKGCPRTCTNRLKLTFVNGRFRLSRYERRRLAVVIGCRVGHLIDSRINHRQGRSKSS